MSNNNLAEHFQGPTDGFAAHHYGVKFAHFTNPAVPTIAADYVFMHGKLIGSVYPVGGDIVILSVYKFEDNSVATLRNFFSMTEEAPTFPGLYELIDELPEEYEYLPTPAVN